jgi:capsule polysaccharide export protein KpsE/RkpR
LLCSRARAPARFDHSPSPTKAAKPSEARAGVRISRLHEEVVMANEMTELKLRVEAKKKDLEAQIAKFKADSMGNANGAIEALQKRLNSLEGDLKHGWDNVSESVASKLNRWLSDKDADKH